MSTRSGQHPSPRRSPSLGVSGITLLMLVTLTLTTTPALSKDRQFGQASTSRTEINPERAMPAERSVRRVGGQREVPNRHTRPLNPKAALAASHTSLRTLGPLESRRGEPMLRPAAGVDVALLNLPPPQA